MKLLWKPIAWLVSKPAVANWLIERAMKTPYSHIYANSDGRNTYDKTPVVYMERYWLFNPYKRSAQGQERSRFNWFPWNIRIHHICRHDIDPDMHDHPWNARTIILRGWYIEERLVEASIRQKLDLQTRMIDMGPDWGVVQLFNRSAGDTARLNFGEYHRIRSVSEGGVWTVFITGKYQGTWGFLVNGAKVQWRKYLGIDK